MTQPAAPDAQPEGSGTPTPPASARPPQRSQNYFLRHWRGELSLPLSYWGNGVLVGFIFVIVWQVLDSISEDWDLRVAAIVAIAVNLLWVPARGWQLIGTWRSANKHASRGGSAGWATTAKVFLIISIIASFKVFGSRTLPQVVAYLKILGGDTDIPEFQIVVLPGGKELELRGGLRAGSAGTFEKVLKANPEVKVLHIESIGGRVHDALRMAQLVRERGLTTYTAERCASAATLVFIAGKERAIAAGAQMGFHASSFPGMSNEQTKSANERVRDAMRVAGVEHRFINQVLSTPNERMWYPTIEEMQSAGVVTRKTLGEGFAAPGSFRKFSSMESIDRELKNMPAFGAIRELEPDVYSKMLTEFSAAVRDGKSEGEAFAVIAGAAENLVAKYTPIASDEALLGSRDQIIGMLVKYKEKRSDACIAVFTHAKINFARAFPDWDMTNSLYLVEKYVRSSEKGAVTTIDAKAADEDIAKIFKEMTAQYGERVELLDKQDSWAKHPKLVCDMILAMYSGTTNLSKAREANLVRYLLSPQKPRT